MDNLENKIVFITGASSGIGEACAIEFAKLKAKLILCARRVDRLEKLSSELKNNCGVNTKLLKLDVTNFNSVKESFDSLPPEWKLVDILLNNAGKALGFDRIYDGKLEHWEEMIDTNIKGLLYSTRVILPEMVKHNSGHIINIGSTAGHEVYPMGNVYAATKFAVKSLSQSIRIDVLENGIKVSSVDPGMVETEFSKVRFSRDEERAKKVYTGLTPLTAKDVAEAVIFCATRPSHVNINEIILTPLAQASSNFIVRK